MKLPKLFEELRKKANNGSRLYEVYGAGYEAAYADLMREVIEPAMDALRKLKGPLKYAYEDRADKYYLNCFDDLEKTLESLREKLKE